MEGSFGFFFLCSIRKNKYVSDTCVMFMYVNHWIFREKCGKTVNIVRERVD